MRVCGEDLVRDAAVMYNKKFHHSIGKLRGILNQLANRGAPNSAIRAARIAIAGIIEVQAKVVLEKWLLEHELSHYKSMRERCTCKNVKT